MDKEIMDIKFLKDNLNLYLVHINSLFEKKKHSKEKEKPEHGGFELQPHWIYEI